MKSAIVFLSAFLIMQGAITDLAISQSDSRQEYVGRPEPIEEGGMNFWYLVDQGGEKVELLGAPEEFKKKNKQVGACIEKAANNEKQIRLTGIWKEDGEGFLLDIASATCMEINGARDCPEKIIGTETITGIYKGVECGDFCYITLKLKDGSEFSAYADEEEVEKLFGKKTGQKVSVVFEKRQLWTSEGGPEDDRPDAPGWCSISPVFKTGTVLSK